MSSSAETSDILIENYLACLEAALAGVSAPEKEEILREIRAHIVDSVTDSADRDTATQNVLLSLGAPAELAERYRTECVLTRASRSFSPLLLLQSSWRWAKLGATGTIIFLFAVIGYGTAIGFTLTLLLKPLMPSRVGMWIGSGNLFVGIPVSHAGIHEVLGQWFVPVIAPLAFAIAVGTTSALRWLFRKRAARAPHYTIPATLSRSV